jgi:hypothetical protein
MALALEDYKRVSGRLEVDDIDFDAFRTQPLAPEHLRCVRYMHDIEHHTTCYLRNLLNTRAHDDPEITAFLTMWNFEEFWHGEALGRVLAAHGEPSESRVADLRRRQGWKRDLAPLFFAAASGINRQFVTVHMTFGVINEWTTQAGYARLGQLADHPVLSELLRRIMKQEGLHIDFYRTQARQRLEASAAARRTTRRWVKRLWDPVGAKVMPKEETRHLISTLFKGGEGLKVSARLDRRVDALPGLDGLTLMEGAVARYG